VAWDGSDGTFDDAETAKLKLNSSSRIVQLADPKGIVNIMRCSRCRTIPIPPKVAICNDGHYICGPCVRTVGVTALCVQPITKTDNEGQVGTVECGQKIGRYKSELYEYLYKSSTFHCPNAEAGCTKTPLGSAMKAHVKLCPYRPTLPCPNTKCPIGLVSPLAYVKHVQIHHPNTSTLDNVLGKIQVLDEHMNDPASADSPNCRWLSCLIHCFGLTFMLMVDERGGLIYTWVSLAQDEGIVQGRKFQVRLNFCTTNPRAGAGGMWEGDIYPFEKGFEDIVAEGDLLFTTRAALTKRYLIKSGDIASWNIDIRLYEMLHIRPYPNNANLPLPPGTELYFHDPYTNFLIEKSKPGYEVPATAPLLASQVVENDEEGKTPTAEAEAEATEPTEDVDAGDDVVPDLTIEILAHEKEEIERQAAAAAAAAEQEQMEAAQREKDKENVQKKQVTGQDQAQCQSQRPIPRQRLQMNLTNNPFTVRPGQDNEGSTSADGDGDDEPEGEDDEEGGEDGQQLSKPQLCLRELQDLIEKKDFTRYSAYTTFGP
jgi:hypothetical protein